MKKTISFLSVMLVSILMVSAMASTVLAAGGKVRGDNASGPAIQNCVDGEGVCPFLG